MHLKEGKPKSIQEIGERAANYVEAHTSEIVFGIDPKPSNIQSLRSETRQCHSCKGFGHLQSQCPKPKPLSPRRFRSTPGLTFRNLHNQDNKFKSNSRQGHKDRLSNRDQVYGATYAASLDISSGTVSQDLLLLLL